VKVPDTAGAHLDFNYRMITYDIAQDDLRQIWDFFGVYIDGELVFSYGNTSSTVPGSRHEKEWTGEDVSLARWRGQEVELKLENHNGYSRGPAADRHNTWTFVDDVYVLP
jgi:hypothetical protein